MGTTTFFAPCRPERHRRRQQRRPTAVAALVLAAATVTPAAAACTSDGPHQVASGQIRPATTARPAPSQAPATTSTVPPTPEDKVAAAYLEADAVYANALLDPWHPDARLSETQVEPSLTNTYNILRVQAEGGIVSRYPDGKPPTIAIRSIELRDRTAIVHACHLNDALQVRANDGTVVNDDVASGLLRAEMVFTGRRWKLRQQELLKVWKDKRQCQQ